MKQTRIARMSDELLVNELIVALALNDMERAFTLTLEVCDRNLVAQAKAAAIKWTADEKRRRGQA